jgi:RNA polymerase sigma-70 factor (ECF subfamily)
MTFVTIDKNRFKIPYSPVQEEGTKPRIKSIVDDGEKLRLQKARKLDRKELTGIYEEYHQPIYSYIYKRVGDVEMARDLAAEVFRRFLLALQKGAGPDVSIRAWLYRSAHNAVIDHYRSRRYREHLPLDEGLPNAEIGPGQVVEQRMAAHQVREAISYLTPDQQQVITLKFFGGLSNHEVARIADKTVGAVKSLQHRALASLGRHLTRANQAARDKPVMNDKDAT